MERTNAKEVFKLASEASRSLWRAVAIVQTSKVEDQQDLTQALMQLRGEIHINVLRPLYREHPDLADLFKGDQDNFADA